MDLLFQFSVLIVKVRQSLALIVLHVNRNIIELKSSFKEYTQFTLTSEQKSTKNICINLIYGD